MKYEFWVGLRYLLGRRKEKFISLISLISIIGVMTGVAALIIVIGVMTGFDNELRDRIIGTSSHIVVQKIGGIDDVDFLQKKIEGVDNVLAVAPFVNAQVLIMDKDKKFPVAMRGISLELEKKVTAINKFITQGELSLNSNTIIIGKELSQHLLVTVGDTVELVGLSSLNQKKFTVGGIFSCGMYDYDSGVVFAALDQVQAFNENVDLVEGMSVRIENVYRANFVKKNIQKALGFPYYARTWMDLNSNLFNALKLEKTAMFVVLTLIVMVAALNIGSTLIMMVMEKTKDIGILKSIGATDASIRFIFTSVGIAIGIIGTILGTVFGVTVSYLLKTYEFIKLPKDVYYIDKLPVSIDPFDIGWIVLAAMCITLLATLYPSHQAAKLNPVEALRYE